MAQQGAQQAGLPSPQAVIQGRHGGWLQALGIGAALGAAALVVAALLPTKAAFGFFAIVLGVIAGTYLGFGIRDGRLRNLSTESMGLVVYAALATAALATENAVVLAAGLFGHVLWDLLHHPHRRGLDTTLPNWLIPLCIGADVALAISVVIRFI